MYMTLPLITQIDTHRNVDT